MLRYLKDLKDSSAEGWPRAVASRHDAVLAESYAAPKKKRH